jgi:hypothetical protein
MVKQVRQANCQQLEKHILAEYPSLESVFHPPEKDKTASASAPPAPKATKETKPQPQPQPAKTNEAPQDPDAPSPEEILGRLSDALCPGQPRKGSYSKKERELAAQCGASDEQLHLIWAFYHVADKKPERTLLKKQTLGNLLDGLAGECERARAHFRKFPEDDPRSGTTRRQNRAQPVGWREAVKHIFPPHEHAKAAFYNSYWDLPEDYRKRLEAYPPPGFDPKEPEGWREALIKKGYRAEGDKGVNTCRSWSCVHEDIRKLFPQFPQFPD